MPDPLPDPKAGAFKVWQLAKSLSAADSDRCRAVGPQSKGQAVSDVAVEKLLEQGKPRMIRAVRWLASTYMDYAGALHILENLRQSQHTFAPSLSERERERAGGPKLTKSSSMTRSNRLQKVGDHFSM